jgi:probable HAF family extracellular repeat protein
MNVTSSPLPRLLTLLSVLGTCPGLADARNPTLYTVTDVGTLGGTFSENVGINNRGSTSGFSTLPGDIAVHGFLWREGQMTDLGTLGGPNSVAPEQAPPSEREEVVGASDIAVLDPNPQTFCPIFFLGDGYVCRAFVWRAGTMTELPTLGGNNAASVAINNRGQIIGASESTRKDPDCSPPQVFDIEAVLWEASKGVIKELPPLPGDTEAVAEDINDAGEVAGTSGNCAAGAIEAVLWRHGRPIDLGTLGGAVFNIAFALNNRGQVVGQSDLPGDVTHHGFLWQKGVMTDLGSILGLPVSLAASINNQGQVVGFSQELDSSNTVAWIWQDGVMTDLNTLIPPDSPWFLIEALGINNRGQITGYALNSVTSEVHGVVLTPDPNSESSASAGRAGANRLVTLPENVRQMLKRMNARFHRFESSGPR